MSGTGCFNEGIIIHSFFMGLDGFNFLGKKEKEPEWLSGLLAEVKRERPDVNVRFRRTDENKNVIVRIENNTGKGEYGIGNNPETAKRALLLFIDEANE